MSRHQHTEPVHLEAYVDGDASAGIEFKVFRAGGGAEDITAQISGSTTQGIVITDVELVTENAAALLLCANANTDGERVCGGPVGANSGIKGAFKTPHYCKVGKIPKLFGAATGKTRGILHGYIYKGS